MEAEYIALCESVKEGIWLKLLEKDLQVTESKLIILEDNQSCIKTASDVVHSNRSKHIDVRYHFIRQLVESRKLEIHYCPTEYMVADILTKSLGKISHARHTAALLSNSI